MEEKRVFDILKRIICRTPKIQCGKITGISCPAGEYIDIEVAFPKEFSETPKMIPCFESTSSAAGFGSCNISVHDVTKSGGVIRMFNNDTGNRAPYIVWIAVVPEILAGGGYSVAAIFLGRWRLHEAIHALEKDYLNQAKQNMDENWEWTRYGPIFLDRIYGSERICDIRRSKGGPTYPDINRAIEWVHNAICGLLQQCNICHLVENASSNSKSTCRIYGKFGDLRPVTGVIV